MSSQQPGFFARNVWVLLLVALVLALGVGTVLTQANNTRDLDAQSQRISTLSDRLEKAQLANEEAEEANVYQALGIAGSRLVSDRQAIENVLTTAFSWNNGEEYAAARDELITRFDLDEGGEFLTEFLPPVDYRIVDGQREYYIDRVGLEFSIDDDFSADVVRVVGTDYEYLVLADVTVTSSKVTPGSDGDEPTSTRRMLLHISVDDQGEVFDLSGIPPSGSTRSSA